MIECNAEKVLTLFSNLSTKNQSKVFRNALRKGSQILVNETRTQLKKRVKKITTIHTTKKGATYSLSKGIRYKLVKGEDYEARINITGDFRLRFFELGTEERLYTHKKSGKTHKTGSIRGFNFFATAKATKEHEIFNSMNRLLSESIQRIARK